MELTKEQIEALKKAFNTQVSREKFDQFFELELDYIKSLKNDLAELSRQASDIVAESQGLSGEEIMADERLIEVLKEHKLLSIDLRQTERRIRDAEIFLTFLGIEIE